MSERALSPVIGSVILVLIVVSASIVVGATVLAMSPVAPAPNVEFALSADADTGTIAVTHERGDPIDVRSVRLVVEIDGSPLRHQPPVPFFSVTGFEPGPTGPFNLAADPKWTAGQTGTFTLDSDNNEPGEIPKDGTVTLRIYAGEQPIANLETRAS